MVESSADMLSLALVSFVGDVGAEKHFLSETDLCSGVEKNEEGSDLLSFERQRLSLHSMSNSSVLDQEGDDGDFEEVSLHVTFSTHELFDELVSRSCSFLWFVSADDIDCTGVKTFVGMGICEAL